MGGGVGVGGSRLSETQGDGQGPLRQSEGHLQVPREAFRPAKGGGASRVCVLLCKFYGDGGKSARCWVRARNRCWTHP